jgi:hypothetical protein
MPRHLYLKPQLTSDELKQRYRDSQDAITECVKCWLPLI